MRLQKIKFSDSLSTSDAKTDKPEISKEWEIGIEKVTNSIFIYSNYFMKKIRDMIKWVSNPVIWMPSNVLKTKISGVETGKYVKKYVDKSITGHEYYESYFVTNAKISMDIKSDKLNSKIFCWC